MLKFENLSWNNTWELCQYHGCWCPVSCITISAAMILTIWNGDVPVFSITCNISVLRDHRKCRYIFVPSKQFSMERANSMMNSMNPQKPFYTAFPRQHWHEYLISMGEIMISIFNEAKLIASRAVSDNYTNDIKIPEQYQNWFTSKIPIHIPNTKNIDNKT